MMYSLHSYVALGRDLVESYSGVLVLIHGCCFRPVTIRRSPRAPPGQCNDQDGALHASHLYRQCHSGRCAGRWLAGPFTPLPCAPASFLVEAEERQQVIRPGKGAFLGTNTYILDLPGNLDRQVIDSDCTGVDARTFRRRTTPMDERPRTHVEGHAYLEDASRDPIPGRSPTRIEPRGSVQGANRIAASARSLPNLGLAAVVPADCEHQPFMDGP